MTLPDSSGEDSTQNQPGQGQSQITSRSNGGGRQSTNVVTPRDLRAPGYRNRSVMSDMLPDSRLSFLPIIRRSSMASSIASSIKSTSLYSSSTGSNSPMSGPPTGFSSPSKLINLPKLLLREMQPDYFDVRDEMDFNRCLRFPQLESSPTDCRLNLVAQKLQEGTTGNDHYDTSVSIPVPEFHENRNSRESERESPPKRKRRKNRKRSEQRQKTAETDQPEK